MRFSYLRVGGGADSDSLVVIGTIPLLHNMIKLFIQLGTTVAQWLRNCATNRKVTSSIPAGVSGILIDKKSFRSHFGSGVD